ncbi:hypothetical protein [Flavobacterium sp. 316]|uniref:hypothetical protein n=1 Tax=Flavobacterium sp. 316 TaxID=1603293 RepID=UPI000AC0F8C0|nr:hypothetical protein [Flavobacterium sp. 316]
MKILKNIQLKAKVLTKKELLTIVGGDDVTDSIETESDESSRTKDGGVRIPPRG